MPTDRKLCAPVPPSVGEEHTAPGPAPVDADAGLRAAFEPASEPEASSRLAPIRWPRASSTLLRVPRALGHCRSARALPLHLPADPLLHRLHSSRCSYVPFSTADVRRIHGVGRAWEGPGPCRRSARALASHARGAWMVAQQARKTADKSLRTPTLESLHYIRNREQRT